MQLHFYNSSSKVLVLFYMPYTLLMNLVIFDYFRNIYINVAEPPQIQKSVKA